MTTNTCRLPTPAAETHAARHLIGHVIDADGDACLVGVGENLYEAGRALSCLVAAQPGDRVAMLVEADNTAHLLAVLERTAPGTLRIATERDLAIESRGELSLRGGVFSAVAERSQLLLGKLRVVAAEVAAESRLLKFVAQAAHTVVDSLHLVAQRSFRHIEQSDHQRCAYLDLEAEQLVQIRARNTMISAKQLTRVDGSQIHVG